MSLAAYKRVTALADVAHRYAAVIRVLTSAMEEAVEAVYDPEVVSLLRAALADSDAQIAAISDALNKALDDLPEGQADG